MDQARALWAARNAWRASPAAFAVRLSKGRWKRAKHLELLSTTLREAAHVPGTRVIVAMPVRHGKTELTSIWTPVWYLDRFPEKRVLLISHGAQFAQGLGRRVRNTMAEHQDKLSTKLSLDSKSAGEWHTTDGGGMKCTGIGGDIIGRGADFLIVDDYCQSDEQAYSEPWRNKVMKIWHSTISTRLEPGASVVIVATRWHEDDLVGRLLAADSKNKWTVISLPAICEEEGDPIGRKVGEALWEDRWPLWKMQEEKEEKPSLVWAALYQQRPSPLTGNLFQRGWWKRYRVAGFDAQGRPAAVILPEGGVVPLESMAVFNTVDLATTEKEENDWSVVSSWGVIPGSRLRLALLCVDRFKVEGPALIPRIRAGEDRWDAEASWIEAVAFQLSLVQSYVATGGKGRKLKRKKSKMGRAISATPQIESGAILIPEDGTTDWLDEFLREVHAFPKGKWDDQVDTMCDAVDIARKRRGVAGVEAEYGG